MRRSEEMAYGYDKAPTDPVHGGKMTAEQAGARIAELEAALRAAPMVPPGLLKPDAGYQIRTGEWFEDYISWQFDHQATAFVVPA